MSDDSPRFVRFTPEGFNTFLNVLHETYGSAGNAMIYNMAEKYGKTLILTHVPNMPDDPQAQIATLKMYAERFGPLGWGVLTLEDIDLEKGRIRVLIEDRPFGPSKGSDDTPSDIFTRGVMAGILGAFLKKELSVEKWDSTVGSTNYRIEYKFS